MQYKRLYIVLLMLLGASCTSPLLTLKEVGSTVAMFEVASSIAALNHEMGHWDATQEDGWNQDAHIRLAWGRLFSDYAREFRERPSLRIGVGFATYTSYGFVSGQFRQKPIAGQDWEKNWKQLIPRVQRLELGGVRADERAFYTLNAALRDGKLSGRLAHACAFSAALDLPMYAIADAAFYNGDLAWYTKYAGGTRQSLTTIACIDLVGKLPDLVWHWNGMRGKPTPPPTWWRIGRLGIRLSAVTTERTLGYGLTINLTW